MGKRGPKPYGRTSRVWSAKLAYGIGLIASDGCLSSDGRSVNFTSKDEELVHVFCECLGISAAIGKKKSGTSAEKIYSYVQFKDILFYQWLLSIGLTPRKSKTINVLRIPDEYFFDFLRGCWDGDGSINAYWDPRWHSSYMFYTDIASASLPFLIWLQANIVRLGGPLGHIKRGRRKTLQLRFAKQGSKLLLQKMFHTGSLPSLRRKFAKTQEILKIDENHARVSKLVDEHA